MRNCWTLVLKPIAAAHTTVRSTATVHLESPVPSKFDHLDANVELNRIGGLGRVSGLYILQNDEKIPTHHTVGTSVCSVHGFDTVRTTAFEEDT